VGICDCNYVKEGWQMSPYKSSQMLVGWWSEPVMQISGTWCAQFASSTAKFMAEHKDLGKGTWSSRQQWGHFGGRSWLLKDGLYTTMAFPEQISFGRCTPRLAICHSMVHAAWIRMQLRISLCNILWKKWHGLYYNVAKRLLWWRLGYMQYKAIVSRGIDLKTLQY